MAQTSLLPVPKQQFLDENGNPYSGGKLYFYEPGTSTAKAVYSDSNGTTALSNPVILDGAGRASVWLNGYYKVILKDANDTSIYTIDNISSQYSEIQEDFQFIEQNDTLTYIGTTQFSVPDDRTSHYEIGRRIEANVTAGTIYGTITASNASGSPTITTITCLWDSGALDSGLANVSTGVISVANNALPNYPTLNKTAGYSMAVTDINQIVQYSNANAANFTLLGANAVPSGAWNLFKNANSGAMNLIGTINGVANRTLYNNSALYVYSDGANWNAPGEATYLMPIGSVIWWHKSLSGVPSTLPYGWVECNGQTLSDANSPLNGQTIPNINGSNYFVRGSNTSGNTQANQNLEHLHAKGTLSVTLAGNVNAPVLSAGNVSQGNAYGFFGDGQGTYANLGDPANGNISANQLKVLIELGNANFSATVGGNTANSGSTESRPDNISMVAIMRVK